MKSRPRLIVLIALLSALSCGGETTAPPHDNTHPSEPTGLVATQVSRAHVRVTWQPSTDNVGVTGYTTKVFDVNDNRYLAIISSPGPECIDTLAIPWEPTRYNVVAWDAAGNGQTSGYMSFVVIPTAADVAGTWRLAACYSDFVILRDDGCAGTITFTVSPDSTITGTMTNIEMAAPKGGNVYELFTMPTTTLSGRFTGQTIHLSVAPASDTNQNLTGGTIDISIAPRPSAGWAYRLRQAQGTYSFTGSKYSIIDYQWHNAYNTGTISFVR